jgi:hypothetical protein
MDNRKYIISNLSCSPSVTDYKNIICLTSTGHISVGNKLLLDKSNFSNINNIPIFTYNNKEYIDGTEIFKQIWFQLKELKNIYICEKLDKYICKDVIDIVIMYKG